MLNLKEKILQYTGLLIRLDDISENMNWDLMDKCEKIFDQFNIKPLLGVIPNNKDLELKKYPKNSNFWSRVKSWEDKGWEISMHGFTHLYEKETYKKDFFNYGGRSEFYGFGYNQQLNKIKLGLQVFNEKKIKVRSFFAPNHTYDINTFKALKENNLNIIIDGYGLFPFNKHKLFFIPQLFYKEIFLPFGIQSTQIHLNYWDEEKFKKFEKFIHKNSSKIVDINYILKLDTNNFVKNTINLSVEKTLKIIRHFK